MDIKKIKAQIPDEFYDQFKILDGTLEEEQARQDYLQSICQRLIGDDIDFEKFPVYFCIVDDENPNAAFVPPKRAQILEPQDEWGIPRSEEEIKEAAREQCPTIFVTKGLLNMVENEDQLAYILGHELGHFRQDFLLGSHYNSKMEELTSDLNSLDLMVKAGYDINEARKIVSRIFTNEQMYYSLKEILIRSMDAHPNNESRLNAVDIKIKSIEDDYQKKNININDVEETPIPDHIKEDYTNNRYVSFFEKELKELGYYDAPLAQKQEILLSYMGELTHRPEFWSKDSRFSNYLKSHYSSALDKIVYNHIAEVRKQMPMRVIKQSDADYFKGWLGYQQKEQDLERWMNIVGKEYCDIHSDKFYLPDGQTERQKILDSFPFKIVPDEEYEAQLAIEAQKEQKHRKDLENGTDLSLQLWDKLISLRKTEYYRYATLALTPLSGIDANQTTTGTLAIEAINRAIADEYYSSEAIRMLFGSYFPSHNEEEKLDSSVRLVYRPIRSRFYYKFKPELFPSLNLETTENPTMTHLPRNILFDNDIDDSHFGLSKEQLLGDIYCIHYNMNHQNLYPTEEVDKYWCYFVNRSGKILASFPPEKLEDKKHELIEEQRIEYLRQHAELIKQDYAKFLSLKHNPEGTHLQPYELFRLKRYTSACSIGINAKRDADGKFEKDFIIKTYMATLAVDDPYITYNPRTLKDVLYHEHLELKDKSPLAYQYKEFDEEVILSFLTDEEKEFASRKYSSENDEIIFNAFYRDMVQNGTYDIRLSRYNMSEYSDYREGSYVLQYGLDELFTHEQALRYMQTYLDITPAEQIKNSYRQDVENMVKFEFHNLFAFIEQNRTYNPDVAYKDIDFTKYQPVITEKLSQKLGIPLDLTNYTKKDNLTSSETIFLSYALTHHILSGKTDKLPLKEFFNNCSTTVYLKNVVKEKFEPFIINRENYPKDTLDAIKTYKEIPGDIKDIEKISPFIVDMLRAEKDPKKSLKATLVFLETLKYENTNITSNIKNQLLENSIIFDKNLPLIQRIGAYQQIEQVSGFADDYKIQNQLLEGFIEEIEAIKDPLERNAHYDIFINKQHRISDPDIRRKYQNLWVESVFDACGRRIDDNSEELHAKIAPFIEKLHGSYKTKFFSEEKTEDNVNMADRLEIAKILADRFVSQEKLSMQIRPKPSGFDEMQQGNRDNNSIMIAGFDTVKMLVDRKPSEATELIDFLLSKGDAEQCQKYGKHITETLNDMFNGYSSVKKDISPETLQILHREFWGYPLEARAVLINELLHSSSQSSNEERWEDIFKKVAPKIFPNADSDMSKIGTEFLHSYIKSRKDNERTLYLAAMMVAANENSSTTDPEKSIAKGIRLFLENSGPAAIKLGQAMASYTDVPKFIRDEMQELKSNASRPSRWEIYKWLDFYKNSDNDHNLEFGKDVWLGKILGSASYFVTLEKGQFEDGKIPFQTDRVTKILRAGAKISSDKEFKIFEKMLLDLADKGVMKNGVDTFMRLIEQAKDTVKIETDLGIGYEQLQTAKELYKEKEISIDGHTFKVHVADWPSYGKNWADLERAQGVDLDKIKDHSYKKSVSKAYFSLELMNMLAGGKFDHDRHGKQLKIDTQNNVIGVFDTGAMAVVDPDPKDKEILGKIIYKTLEKTLADKEGGFSKVGAILSEEIDKVYTSRETTSPYLTECQRGLLALTDFYKDFSNEDFIDCFNAAMNNKEMPLDKHIMNGFINEAVKSIGIFESEQSLLSYEDKEKLGALLFNISATRFMHDDKKVPEIVDEEIAKMQSSVETPMPILSIISSKMNDVKQGPLGLDIPKEFIPTLGDFIERQNVDVAILKGMAREMLNAIDLQKEQEQYSPADRQEFGRLIYDTFDAYRKNPNQDIAQTFLTLQKEGNYNSEYAAKIAMVVTVASKIQVKENEQGFNAEELIKAVLLSGKMDKEVVKGITDGIKAKNPDSVTRGIAAKAVSSFLTQKTAEPNIFKKALIRMFVKKKNALGTAKQTINETIENADTRKKLVNYIKGYIDKMARLGSIKDSQNKSEPKIKITTPTYTR